MSRTNVVRPAVGAVLLVTLVLVGWLSTSALHALWAPPSASAGTPRALSATLVLALGAFTCVSVATREFSLAAASFWAWSFVFLGLAPAAQLAAGRFPWGGGFDESAVVTALTVVLIGNAAFVLGAALRARQRRSRQERPQRGGARRGSRPHLSEATRLITALGVLQIVSSVVFLGLMGSAMFRGRAIFQERLVAAAGLPGGGTLYFIATAAAITVPAVLVVARRSGARIDPLLVAASVALGFAVTNPLVGSRFLTGSFFVAVVGAAVLGRTAARWIPAGITALLVTVFPSLDVLRGDGTGAARVEIVPPSKALTSFDFDSFEMLVRAVAYRGSTDMSIWDGVISTIAPLLRWIPVLSNYVAGQATGTRVANGTGMGFTNVSMPLWGEAHFAGGVVVVVVVFFLLGRFIRAIMVTAGMRARIIDAPVAALLFIVLRGSLYEVLGYLIFAGVVWVLLVRSGRRRSGDSIPMPTVLYRGGSR